MESHQLTSMISMANQIAANLPHDQSQDECDKAVASHLQRFWSRGMKEQIRAHLAAGGEGLSEGAKRALALI
jgi:formate dehydrogenase subunit delta